MVLSAEVTGIGTVANIMSLLRLRVVVCLFIWGIGVHSKPYFFLTSTRSKCFSVVAPQGQTITVSYHAPDMQMLDEDEELNAAKLATEIQKPEDRDEADGPDADWNRRMKEKLERMKQKKMRDVSITVTQKAGLAGALASRQRKRYGDDKVTGQGRVREELSQRQGTIEFLTGEDDGTVDICVQSITANRNSPSRISIDVTMAADEESEDEEIVKKEASGANVDHSAAKEQMSRLERDLQTLSNRVRAILNNADFNKDQEVAFHDQSVAMNNAAMYWPIIQILVIAGTGFVQAHHIIRYMRTHHIGI